MPTKPTLFAGLPLPLSELSPDAFQAFVHEALIAISPALGLDVQGLAGAGGDDGFDSWARRRSDQAIVCIQSKRLKKALNLSDVGVELAKVALTSWLTKSEVKEHFFIAAGAIATTVARALRAKSRKELLDASLKQTANPKLAHVVEQVETRSGTPSQIVAKYVDGLERIQAWSGAEFNARISAVWSSLQDAIERTFVVHSILRERPRPDFDESHYLETVIKGTPPSISLTIVSTSVPSNLRSQSAASPRVAAPETTRSTGPFVGHPVETLLEVNTRECFVLIGPGGAGKSTTLAHLAAKAATARMDDASAPLPVVLQLAFYKSDINELTHSRLGITHGHWQSLPGPFLLLLDGLNEVTRSIAQSIANDISRLADHVKRISFVLSLRADLAHPIVLTVPHACFRFVGLGTAQIHEVATLALPKENVAPFVQAVLSLARSRSGGRLFSLPFVVRYAAEVFRAEKQLPSTLGEILERVLRLRFERNQEIEVQHGALAIPFSTLQHLSGAVAFHMRVRLGRNVITRIELESLIRKLKLECENVFGLGELSDVEILQVLLRHEHLTTSGDTFSFQHDLLAGFLAARHLAAEWKDQLGTVQTHSADDAWRFVGRHLQKAEGLDLIKTIATNDPYLAAQIAMEIDASELVASSFVDLQRTWLDSDLRAWIWMLSLSILAEEKGRDALRRIRASSAPGSIRHGQATRALARTGDEAILKALQRTADHETSPGRSGGDIAIWEEDTPPFIALSLARSRLAALQSNDRVGASIRTVARYRSEEDVDILERVMRTTLDSDAFTYAAQALRKHARERAHRVMEEILPGADVWRRLRILGMLASDGQLVDTAWLMGVAIRDRSRIMTDFGVDASNARALQERAVGVLKLATLSADDKTTVLHAIQNSDKAQRQIAWTIATEHELEGLDEFALRAVEMAASDGDIVDVGQACLFACRRDLPKDLSDRFSTAVRVYVRDRSELFEWDMVRALEYLAQQEQHEEVVPVVQQILERWIEAKTAVQRGDPVSVSLKRGLLAGRPLDDMDLDLLFTGYCDLLPSYADALPSSLRVKLLGFDPMDSGSQDAQSKLLRGIANDILDEELSGLDSLERRVSAVKKLAPYGATPLRAKVLQEGIRAALRIEPLLRAASLMWNETVARAVVEGIASIDWSHELAYLAADDLIRNPPPFDRDLVARILVPVLNQPLSGHSREVLETWCDIGQRRDPQPP